MVSTPLKETPTQEGQLANALETQIFFEKSRPAFTKRIQAIYSDPIAINQYIKVNQEGIPAAEAAAYQRYLKQDGLCLDIGCGTGRTILPLTEKGLKIIGIDITKEMLFEAQNQAKQRNLKLHLAVGDWRHLLFKNEIFDTVIVNRHVFQHFHKDDRILMLKEAKRVLKKDGTLILHITNSDHLFSFPSSLYFLTRFFLKIRKKVLFSKQAWIKNSFIGKIFQNAKLEYLLLFYLQTISTYIPSIFIDPPRKIFEKLLGVRYHGFVPRCRITKKDKNHKSLGGIPYYIFFADDMAHEIRQSGLTLIDNQSIWELAFNAKLPAFLRSHAPESYFFVGKSFNNNLNVPGDFIFEPLDEAITLLKQGLSRNKNLAFDIISNSMKPVCVAGDRLSAREIQFPKLQLGDLIIFKLKNQLLAHRIVNFKNDGSIVTKGDNTLAIDEPISQESIVAKIFKIDAGQFQVNLEDRHWKITNRFLAQISYWQAKYSSNFILRLLLNVVKACVYLFHPLLMRLYFRDRDSKTIGQEMIVRLCETRDFDKNQFIVQQLAKDYRDWEYFLSLALYNNAGPLLYKNLKEYYLPHGPSLSIPQWVTDSLEISYRQSSQKSVSFENDAANLLRKFQENNIKVIVLKGAALIGELYPEAPLRPMEDLDLLIQKQDWPVIKEILEKEGFENKAGLDLLKLEEAASATMNRHIAYINQGGTKVELKFQLFALDFPHAVENKAYFESARQQQITGVEAYTLSLEDQFLYLASRMINVGFRYYLWFHDLKEFLKYYQEINWLTIVKRAKEQRVDVTLYYTLRVLKEKLHTDRIPDHIMSDLVPRPWKRALLDFLFGYQQMGFRKPKKNGRHFHPALHAYFFLYKFGLSPGGVGNMLRYFYKIMLPPVEYLCYRYGISKGQVYLGVGHIKRMKPLILKILQTHKFLFNRY